MSRVLSACTATLLLSLLSVRAGAQEPVLPLPPSAPPPANLAYADGAVDLIHEGVAERATAGTLLLDGDVVRTVTGRAEIVFGDGSLLHLDHDTDVEILSPTRLRLREGRLLVRVSAATMTPYVVDTQAASISLQARGEYGVSANGRFERLEVTVARGIAELDDRGEVTPVRAGEMATILGAGGRVLLQPFNSARYGAFELWASDRANGFAAAPSARQLPVELRPYGPVLDHYGRWDYMAPYGYVWYPSVAVAWRPYYTGAWRATRYGHTWIGHDPWSWPTHHFGRWGFSGVSWYWIPNRVWGPAWVSFNFVSNYVSWCPLGWDGRPVFSFSGRGHYGDHRDFRPNYDPWRGWTVAPRDAFGARRAVHTYAIDPQRLSDDTRRSMSNAVPRGSAPLPDRRRAGADTPSRLTPDPAPHGFAPTRGYAVPRAAALPAAPGRTDNPANIDRRGNGPTPDEVAGQRPRLSSPLVDTPRVETPRADSTRTETPRPDAANESRVDAPGGYARPRREAPPQSAEPPTRSERPAQPDRPARAERPSGGGERSDGGRSAGVAVPRPARQDSPRGNSAGGGGERSGGARRRPR